MVESNFQTQIQQGNITEHNFCFPKYSISISQGIVDIIKKLRNLSLLRKCMCDLSRLVNTLHSSFSVYQNQ